MVKIEAVSFGYTKPKETLNNVDFHAKKGECILLCGESGCGKTTITKMVNGLIPHFYEGGILTGLVTAAGLKVAQTELYRLSKYIGSVFQNPKSQFFNLDSDSEIVFGLENAGIPKEQMEQRFNQTVKDLKIERLLGQNIFAMSGGEKQSLAFASVYAMNPDIFVLDEPTANLDVDAIERLRRQILQVKKEGRTVIVAEHRLYFLTDLIDRAVYLKNGAITQTFSKSEFQALTQEKRIRMGLRSLTISTIDVPRVVEHASANGLSVENLSCSIDKKEIFGQISFLASYGEVLGIIGSNGAGKTTLTRCICGLLKETHGVIRLDGVKLKSKQRNKACFCVMQDVNHQLFSDSVWAECELSCVEGSNTRIEEVLSAFDLLELKDRHPMALSGGQKQRLAVATAVLSDKKVLIFDEPTSGLDYRHMIEVSMVLRKLADDGKIVIVVSHDYEFLNRVCDKALDLETYKRK